MGPKKAKSKMPVDGVDTTSMSREQLEAFCIRLREELDREREERNFFQLERDKLRTFWEITRQQLEESRAQQRNQDRAIDELEEKHQAEIKVYKQKVKHLLYEHQCNLSELQVEGMVSLKQAQDDYNAMEQQLLKDKKELKEKIHDMELKHLEEIRQLKIDHSAEVSRIREQLESDATELEKKYEARITNQAEEQAMREKMEQAELETRKNQHIVDLTKQHETAFQEMKNYYNDITLNNLALISTLKEQIEELKANHDRMEKQLYACQAENKKLAEPFKQAQSELGLLRRQLTTYEQDKVTLANTKQRLLLVTKELEDLRWENDVLELRFEKVEKERDRLHAEFVGAVLDVQQKTGLKGALLEKRMASMRSGVSERTGVSVTGCSTQKSYNKPTNKRPASAPWQTDSAGVTRSRWDRLFSSRRPRSESPDDDICPKRCEARGVKGRGRLRRPRPRPHLSEHTKAILRTRRTNSRALPTKSTERVDGWFQALSESGHPYVPHTKDSCLAKVDLSNHDKITGTYPPPCICGQHANGGRVSSYEAAAALPSADSLNLTFNYLATTFTKHRYYPQILDSVRHSLSPIHSQEHPSDASIHDSLEKPAIPVPQIFPQEVRRPDTAPKGPVISQKFRPLSASRSDGRDRAFSKHKSLNFPPVSRSNTATSLVFSKFIRLPPRPDLPWLHGVKSRYFSVHTAQKRRECAFCHGQPMSIDVEIQTSEHSPTRSSSAEWKRPLLKNITVPETKSDPVDQTPSYLSQILHSPFQLSYGVGHMDRNYAAVVTSPKCDDLNMTVAFSKSFGRSWTEDSASLGPWLPKVVHEDSAPNRRSSRNISLSVSPLRVIDIESEGSEVSSPAMNTAINASREDTGSGLSSLATPSQVDVKISSEPWRSIDVENSVTSIKQYWSSRDNLLERKHERTPLKRKFKTTVLRRLKLKLMICSYMHRHDEEGHVNFVHPSARKRLVEPMSLHRVADPSYDLAESSLESRDTKGPVEEESFSASVSVAKSAEVPPCTRDEKPLYQYFCCVCHSEMTSLWDYAEEDQVCCEECRKKADALLGEYERSQATLKKDFDDSLAIDVISIIGQPISAEVESAFAETKRCLAECDELPSDVGSELWARSWRGVDSFDTDRSSNAGAVCSSAGGRQVGDRVTLLSENDDVVSPAKQLEDSCKTVFENQANAVISEAGLVDDSLETKFANVTEVSRTGFFGGEEEHLLKEISGKESDTRNVLFTMSSVQTAIRSAMRMIKPIKSPSHLSPVGSPVRTVVSPSYPADCSLPLTPAMTSPEGITPPRTFSVISSRSSPTPSEQDIKTPRTDPCPPHRELEDSYPSQSSSDPQQHPNFSSAATMASDPCPSQREPEDSYPCQSSSNLQQHLSIFPATSGLHQSQRKLESASLPSSTPTGDDLRNFDLCMDQTKGEHTPTKPFYVCPLAVPRGILKERTRKLVYTEYPVHTYDFPTNKMACVSKPKNMLVFYEVSKIRNVSQRVKAKTSSDDIETLTKDPLSLPRVSRVDTRPIPSSQFMLRPSRSSLLVSDDTRIVDIRQGTVKGAESERLKSVGATANLSESQSPVDQKQGLPKFSDGRFDLLKRRRRESWILSENSSCSKGVPESGKFRHRSEKLANEDEVGLPRDNESAIAANREKRCQCLKRGRKCNCSLMNHLHIRPLNLPRQLSKASPSPKCFERPFRNLESFPVSSEEGRRDGSLKKSVSCWKNSCSNGENFTSRPSPFWDSSVRPANPNSGTLKYFSRPKKVARQMSTLIEDSSEGLSCQENGSAAIRPSEVGPPAVPTPPPPSPNISPCTPLSGRRDALSRRRAIKVLLRETRTLDDVTHNNRCLPPLAQLRDIDLPADEAEQNRKRRAGRFFC